MKSPSPISASAYRELAESIRNRQVMLTRRTLADMRDKPAKPSKYRNQIVMDGEMRFDSKAEYRHWCHLVLLQKAREIFDLQRQVPFVLAPAAIFGGSKHRALVYIADMTYREGAADGPLVVVDVKGCITDVYRAKRHLMFTVHGIEVREVKRA
jgi:hypothetical protein